ncbi:molecular chaperone DnaJ [SAR202 cluster bacterium AD-804-J14_MRT_500m]|nr:molecular chaperone DnaJ [SAR202 cluster bacterium AD-804-J14_MRT_500m]
MAKKDYYDVLGVSRGSSDDEIRKSFHKKALEYHPDRNKSPGAEAKFKEVNEAYQILNEPEKRARYDRLGHAGVGPDAGFSRDFEGFDIFGGLGDIFDSFFGGATGQSSRAPRRGADLQTRIIISFEDAYSGIEREVELKRTEECRKCNGSRCEPGSSPVQCGTCRGSGQVRRAQRGLFGNFVQVVPCGSCSGLGETIRSPCTSCRGFGSEKRTAKIAVNIPAGIEDGMQVRLTGEGEIGLNGGPPGNLYISISVATHPLFRRDGADLNLALPLNFVQATLGTEVEVPTMEGSESLKIPPGTQPGTVFRIKSKGMPQIRNHRNGDILIAVNLEVPTSVEPEQREVLEELAKAMDWNNGSIKDKGLLDKIKDAFGAT